MLSIIIPAHNEAHAIGRLLNGLLSGMEPREFEILVVCNACSDDTASVAVAFGEAVRVIETPIASKREALGLGDRHASGYPRIYVDADIEILAEGVRLLATALQQPNVLAAAPERVVVRQGVSRTVKWYYDVWERLPSVRAGLFGRGVIAVSELGHSRIAHLPAVMSDDLAVSEIIGPGKAAIVRSARAIVWPPRVLPDLLRRRIRVATGTQQLLDLGLARRSSRTSWRQLCCLIAREPFLAPKVLVFVGISALARASARQRVRAGDFSTWLRDESSRQQPTLAESRDVAVR